MYGILQEIYDATLTGCVTLSHAQKSLTKPQKIKHVNATELNFECHGKGCEYLFTSSFMLSLWGIVCRMLRKIMNVSHFGIRL